MTMKPLPTGEEPPRGYETVVHLGTVDDTIHVHGSLLSQLSRGEMHEIEQLRGKALSQVVGYLGLSDEPLPFAAEKDIIPNKSSSDKIIFCARLNRQLVGYGFVVIDWPKHATWLIQHMIIDPDFRLKGIGSALVEKIEAYALESDIDAASIYAIPIQKSGIDFWRNHGYTKASETHLVHFRNLDHELIVYSKEIEPAAG
ncbi:MAG: GNAT family N-acetyltransferase [Coriobacteriales bacterium]|jgi:GNAT superfamily N-acetyltransferase|nr:GNAT family N-acetyltransferase [Coriobacteriales bacterium]